jgi:cytoskeleton protein RodZ
VSQDSFQDSLFEDPVGLRFRHAREKARWTLEGAAQQLKLPVAVLDAIEREDWQRLGAPIFVRSYVGSYARLLGLPELVADDVVRGKPQPQLASVGNVPPRRRLDRRVGRAARIAMVLVVLAALGALAWYLRSGDGRALYGIL